MTSTPLFLASYPIIVCASLGISQLHSLAQEVLQPGMPHVSVIQFSPPSRRTEQGNGLKRYLLFETFHNSLLPLSPPPQGCIQSVPTLTKELSIRHGVKTQDRTLT